MARPTAALRRRVRRTGGTLLRRWGLVPDGMPDGLGDDDALRGGTLTERVMVFFPDTRTNLYQLQQWYAPLRALNAVHPVVLVLQDSRTARVVAKEAGLHVITVARSATLDDLLSRSDIRLALYVSHHLANFMALRFNGLAHVYLSHGESDKAVMVTNQVKAYDYVFVAGQGAIDRVAQHVILYDAREHLIPIGRPQLAGLALGPDRSARHSTARPTVLYAPTWEGSQPSTTYTSVASHGPVLVASLLASGRYRVIYRPHPRTGATNASYADADARVRAAITTAADRDPAAGHEVDTSSNPYDAMSRADLLISDISAMAMDWLPTARPLIVTVPSEKAAVSVSSRLLDAVPRVAADQAGRAADLVALHLESDPSGGDRNALVAYYFGEVAAADATGRFIEACTDVISRRDAAMAMMRADAETRSDR